MIKTLYNPFVTLTDRQLLYTAIGGTLGGSLLSWLLNCRYPAYITLNPLYETKIYEPLLDNIVVSAALTVILFGLGMLINKKTRLVDIAFTVLIARIPFYLNTLFNINGYLAKSVEESLALAANPTSVKPETLAFILISGLVSLALLVWMCAVLYNGFKTATNSKKTGHVIIFILAVILGHFASGYLIYLTPY